MDAWQLGIAATDWVLANIPAGSKILEFGAGRGTHERARHYEITAIEHNEAYESHDYRCLLAPIVLNEISSQNNEQGWYDPEVLLALEEEEFALIIVDGPPGEVGRSGILALPWILNLAPLVMVDDTHREAERQLAHSISAMMKNADTFVINEESEWGRRETTVLAWK